MLGHTFTALELTTALCRTQLKCGDSTLLATLSDVDELLGLVVAAEANDSTTRNFARAPLITARQNARHHDRIGPCDSRIPTGRQNIGRRRSVLC